ncbi:hypothetical protein D3C72_199380 [compost metagenome]
MGKNFGSLFSLSPQKLVFFLFLFSLQASSSATEVAFAGFAYSGDYKSAAARFPYTKQYDSGLGKNGINGGLQKLLPSINPANYTLVARHSELVGRDQAVSVAMVMTNETVSTEQIGQTHKLFVQLRGQALFFDFKSKTILRAYPFSFAYLDALPETPTEAQKAVAVALVYQGRDGKPGIYERFAAALKQASIPSKVSRFVQVSNVILGDEAKSEFPTLFASDVGETWVADTFGEAISSQVDIPILPYAKGYAIGNVMSMTVADGSVFNLKLPKPDYEFTLNLSKLRKILYDEKPAGKSFIYGSYASIKLEEPLSATIYLDSSFKNGEVKVVPASQLNTEDFPAFQDSIRGLFTKLAMAVAKDNSTWLKSSASASNIEKQVAATRELLQSCK